MRLDQVTFVTEGSKDGTDRACELPFKNGNHRGTRWPTEKENVVFSEGLSSKSFLVRSFVVLLCIQGAMFAPLLEHGGRGLEGSRGRTCVGATSEMHSDGKACVERDWGH